LEPCWFRREARCPLGAREARTRKGIREDEKGSSALLDGLMHFEDEVRAGPEVPRLHHDGEPGLLKLPGDPLRPGLVHSGVADEEVLHVPWIPLRDAVARTDPHYLGEKGFSGNVRAAAVTLKSPPWAGSIQSSMFVST